VLALGSDPVKDYHRKPRYTDVYRGFGGFLFIKKLAEVSFLF